MAAQGQATVVCKIGSTLRSTEFCLLHPSQAYTLERLLWNPEPHAGRMPVTDMDKSSSGEDHLNISEAVTFLSMALP